MALVARLEKAAAISGCVCVPIVCQLERNVSPPSAYFHTFRQYLITVQSRRSKNCRDFPAAAFAESTSRFTAKVNIGGAIIGRKCALTEDGDSNQPCGFAEVCLASPLP